MNNLLENVRADDFVEYFLYVKREIKDVNEQEKLLNSILKEADKIVDNLSDNYIWHKDEFKLSIKLPHISNLLDEERDDAKENLPHLHGITFYGDNIEDEWFVVYLLQQISKNINEIVVKVTDSDGEFLLIEAADYLPSWADPDCCENRVYINDGLIHIVHPTSDNETISIREALRKMTKTKTIASPQIQNSIQNRISGYPQKVADNLHRVNLYLPIGIAAILKTKPNLIAPAILAFCNRDTIDMKACRAMKYFPPENRVYTNVTFTRCLYAMLSHSKYTPDRKTGWNLPSPNDTKFKSHNLGVRVASGFEILASQAKSSSTDIDNDANWHRYLSSLKQKSYFKGLLEHSNEYNDLLNKAKEYFTNNRDTMQSVPEIGGVVLNLMKTIEYDEEELEAEAKNLPKDDDESWLNINPEELDKMLRERYGQKEFMNVNKNTDAAVFTEKVTEFLNRMSCVDGVEFPKDDVTVSEKVTTSKNDSTSSNDAENKVNFDANAFSCAMQNILNFVIPEDDSWDLDSESDMSEYATENTKTTMQQYMDDMDRELSKTTIGESFLKKDEILEEDVENFKPVDIDVNALKNILESYRTQMGDAGPSSNMLGPMGIHFDNDDD